jgi:cytochrome c peroxidase
MKRWRRETTAGVLFFAALTLAGLTALSSGQTPNFGPGPNSQGRGNNNQNQQGGGPPGGGPGGGRQPNSSSEELLGRTIFFDTNLSNPPGMSCSSCHAPEAGFSYPNSSINKNFGTVPGVIPTRYGSRKPMTISYSWFGPDGPTVQRGGGGGGGGPGGRGNRPGRRGGGGTWEGGFFSDGRADSLSLQAAMPLTNPNEMDDLDHGLASPEMVIRKVAAGRYANLFKQVWGDDAFTKPSEDTFRMIRKSVAAFEQSRDVSPFSSKYDAVQRGLAQFTPSELNGLRLFTGSTTGRPGGDANYKSAQCVSCHRISQDQGGRDFFTNWTYANLGVPKNLHSPFYKQTSKAADPQGFNPDGAKFVDLGLGAIVYPKNGLPPGNIGPGSDGRGDYLAANGEFRVSSLRNVDKRPGPGFVKCYMHNGVFKSLKEVVHFYNTRNQTTASETMDLTSAAPAAGLLGKPLWPAPEYAGIETLQNATGRVNGPAARVGNLGLTGQEEDDIVAFLQTLSDGYFTPQRRRPPGN